MNNQSIALITGANKGLGYEIARQLGQQGVTLLVGSRDEINGKAAVDRLQAEGITADWVSIDVTKAETIQAAAEQVNLGFGQLDILINNAGISGGWDQQVPSLIERQLLHEIIDTNFLGQVAVTQAFLPLLRQSEAGRIVNISSGLGSLGQQSDANYAYYGFNTLGYNASKAALNMLTVSLAKELADTTIKVNSADPDWCRTDLGTDAAPYSVEQGAATAVWLATLPADGPTGGFFNSRQPVAW